MRATTQRILAGEDVHKVLETDFMAQVGNAVSGLKNFSFGSGILNKLAGGGGGGATTTTPVTGNTSAPNPGFGGKSMADLAQDSARSQGRGTPAPAPSSAPATKPATEAKSQIGMAKAGSLSKSLQIKSSMGDVSLKSIKPTLESKPDFSRMTTQQLNIHSEKHPEHSDEIRNIQAVRRKDPSKRPQLTTREKMRIPYAAEELINRVAEGADPFALLRR